MKREIAITLILALGIFLNEPTKAQQNLGPAVQASTAGGITMACGPGGTITHITTSTNYWANCYDLVVVTLEYSSIGPNGPWSPIASYPSVPPGLNSGNVTPQSSVASIGMSGPTYQTGWYRSKVSWINRYDCNSTCPVCNGDSYTLPLYLIFSNGFFAPAITGVEEGCIGSCDGSATVTGLSGPPSQYSFLWSIPPTTQTITGLCSGTYSVTISDASTGCTASLSITLTSGDNCGTCNVVNNPSEPQLNPVPDQDCWWSTGGNSDMTVNSKNQLGTTDKTPLRIVTNNTEHMRIEKDGKVGINTIFPMQQLHLNGNQLIDGPGASLFFGGDISGSLRDGEYGIEYMDLGGCSQGLNFWKPFQSHNLSGGNGFANYILFLNDDGNVGIGVDPCHIDPDYKLSVCGKIRALGVSLDAEWCDFVFDKDYKLRTLTEVEHYINENKHLPEIPPANEIEKNGADIGVLLSKQMQKIEELTLYLIQQNKEIEKLKAKLEALK